MHTKYFTVSAHFLAGKGILPEIWERQPCTEEDLAYAETSRDLQIPAELRAYYREIGDRFSFKPDFGHTGFSPSSHYEACHAAISFPQELVAQAEEEIKDRSFHIDRDVLQAEVERRSHWFPFYEIGGGGYYLCLDTARSPSPVCYHEERYWCARVGACGTFELAPSFTEFIRQWSRFCFSDPGRTSIINFCMDRHGTFDWDPKHFDPKYDRGTTEG